MAKKATSTTAAGRLAGRRILITGAGSGIGRAVALRFAAEGAKLALVGRTMSKLAPVAKATGGTAIIADVTDEASVKAMIKTAAKAMGGLDGIVNSAGFTHNPSIEKTKLKDFNAQIAIHMTATFLVCREAIPHLRKAGKATIVNIASVAGLLPGLSGGVYAAAKGGQIVFTKALAMELAPNIRVNVVAAGPANTPLSEPNYQIMKKAGTWDKFMEKFALARISEPEEIAGSVLFLTSDDSSYTTGSVVSAEGGRALH